MVSHSLSMNKSHSLHVSEENWIGNGGKWCNSAASANLFYLSNWPTVHLTNKAPRAQYPFCFHCLSNRVVMHLAGHNLWLMGRIWLDRPQLYRTVFIGAVWGAPVCDQHWSGLIKANSAHTPMCLHLIGSCIDKVATVCVFDSPGYYISVTAFEYLSIKL